MKILVVDDEKTIRKMFCTFLEDLGEVRTASDAEEALEKYSVGNFDLVISDIQMPGEGGIWLLREVKKKKPSQIVFMVSADGNSILEAQSHNPPPDAVFEKPFSLAELKRVIRSLLPKD